jgi:hypothetical protein
MRLVLCSRRRTSWSRMTAACCTSPASGNCCWPCPFERRPGLNRLIPRACGNPEFKTARRLHLVHAPVA